MRVEPYVYDAASDRYDRAEIRGALLSLRLTEPIRRQPRLGLERRHGSFPFHRGPVFAAPGGRVALGSMTQGSLRCAHVSLLAFPDLQRRLLDGARKGERQRPGQSRLEARIHRIQPRRRELTGLSTREERDARNGGGDGSQETCHRGVGDLVDTLWPGAFRA